MAVQPRTDDAVSPDGREASAGTPEADNVPDRRPQPKTILVVDDEPLSRKCLREMLELEGYQVLEAANGAEALEAVEAASVDLVITDIIMPVMEGIETIRWLRAKHPGVRIIAISGGGRTSAVDFLEVAQKFGADHTVCKPIPVREVRTAITRLLAA